MKTYSDERPNVLLPLNDGNYHVNFNISEETMPVGMLGDEQEEPRTQFVYETVFIEGVPTKEKIITAIIRQHYTESKESALNRDKTLRDSGVSTLTTEKQYSDYAAVVSKGNEVANLAMSKYNQE